MAPGTGSFYCIVSHRMRTITGGKDEYKKENTPVDNDSIVYGNYHYHDSCT